MTATTNQPAAFDYASLTCRLPCCDEALHLEWDLSRPLFAGDLAPGEEPPRPEGAHVATWRVACQSGHVLLVPGELLCPCGADDCDHPDVDSEETRTFRAHDIARLARLLDSLTAAADRPWMTRSEDVA